MNPSTRTTKAGSVFWQPEEAGPTFTPFVAVSEHRSDHACVNLPDTSASGSCHHTALCLCLGLHRQQFVAETYPDCTQMIGDGLLGFLFSHRSDERETKELGDRRVAGSSLATDHIMEVDW